MIPARGAHRAGNAAGESELFIGTQLRNLYTANCVRAGSAAVPAHARSWGAAHMLAQYCADSSDPLEQREKGRSMARNGLRTRPPGVDPRAAAGD